MEDEPAVTVSADMAALAIRVSSRDVDAWEDLYRRMHAGLYSYARRRLPSNVAAEDAVSETMIRALNRIDGFSPKGGGLPAWIFGILRNVVLEQQRAATRVVASEIAEQSDNSLPEDRLLAREQQLAMRSAFASLSDEDQELLELRVVGGLSAADAGRVLGKKPGGTRMAQMRALDRLRRTYREVFDAD